MKQKSNQYLVLMDEKELDNKLQWKTSELQVLLDPPRNSSQPIKCFLDKKGFHPRNVVVMPTGKDKPMETLFIFESLEDSLQFVEFCINAEFFVKGIWGDGYETMMAVNTYQLLELIEKEEGMKE